MTQASISVNTVVGSNTDLPINTLVQLNNVGNGGETTYAWTILDQPPGTTDSLSSSTVQNPTFTPKKEGSYLIQLVVNASLSDEQTNRVVCAVRQLKTRIRVPAAGETTEADSNDGYAADANDALRLVDTARADPGVVVAQLGYAATAKQVVYFNGIATIKSTLPGQEVVPVVALASSTGPVPADASRAVLGMVLAAVDGGALSSGKLAYVRLYGLVLAVTVGGSPADETEVFLGVAGAISTSGTRSVGRIIDNTTPSAIYFNGM